MNTTSTLNYVVTACAATRVTHSCVGNFISSPEINLLIAKSTRIEIHLISPDSQRLQHMLDVPIYSRIITLKLFRPQGKTQDLLFVVTERYEFCVFEWCAKTEKVIPRYVSEFSDEIGHLTDNGQIGIIDPGFMLIGLHLYDGLFKVIPFDDKGQFKEAFNIRLEELQVLDIKFLYGCPKPTIVVLYQDNKDSRHVKTYEVVLKDKDFVEGPWSQNNLNSGMNLLIPVPRPLCGVLIIGEETIVYCNALNFIEISIEPSITRAHGKVDVDGSRYLLGDHNGLLHLLVITHEKEKITGLKIELLGETSIASSISYLDNDVVFVGSSYGDSQLIKFDLQPDAEANVEVLERYVNLGPIVDFCVVDLEGQGQGQVVTCSGAYKDGSLRIVGNFITINELVSEELGVIKGMWPLCSATDGPYATFLVVSFITETFVFEMNIDDELEQTEIDGFRSDMKTVFCHDAGFNQFVQVTSSTVRLVSSTTRKLRHEWCVPQGYEINIATANVTQILLATGGGRLFYLEIGDGALTEVKRTQLEYDISCLDINPIGGNQNCSQLAAVGMWTDISVRIFSLPDMNLIRKEHLGGDIIPRSVLLCTFEGISYLLCGLADGHLLNFVLNTSNYELTDKKKVSLGTQEIALRTFSIKSTTRVFATSDRPAVIYSSNKKLFYSNVNLKEVSHMCPFNTAAFPDRLAIAKEGKLTIGTIGNIDDIQKFHVRSIPLGEQARRICHQEQTRTFAICSLKYNQSSADVLERHFVHLLDDQTFDFMSTYPLEKFECGYSILSCSFSDDSNVYYCVGTAYVMLEENEPTKGRVLVFAADGRKLQLIDEKKTKGAVYSLNAFNGKLLASINKSVQLYKWSPRDHVLKSECAYEGEIHALYVQTRGDFILVGDLMHSMSLLIYKHEGQQYAIENQDLHCNNHWMSALEILNDDIYNGEENNIVVRNLEFADKYPLSIYHLGEFVNRFRHGSLVKQLLDSDDGQIPTIIFGTVSGVIGIIASLPPRAVHLLGGAADKYE